jgi:hypothetical protein
MHFMLDFPAFQIIMNQPFLFSPFALDSGHSVASLLFCQCIRHIRNLAINTYLTPILSTLYLTEQKMHLFLRVGLCKIAFMAKTITNDNAFINC